MARKLGRGTSTTPRTPQLRRSRLRVSALAGGLALGLSLLAGGQATAADPGAGHGSGSRTAACLPLADGGQAAAWQKAAPGICPSGSVLVAMDDPGALPPGATVPGGGAGSPGGAGDGMAAPRPAAAPSPLARLFGWAPPAPSIERVCLPRRPRAGEVGFPLIQDDTSCPANYTVALLATGPSGAGSAAPSMPVAAAAIPASAPTRSAFGQQVAGGPVRDICLPADRGVGHAFRLMGESCPANFVRVAGDNPAAAGLSASGAVERGSLTCLRIVDRSRASELRLPMQSDGCPSGTLAVDETGRPGSSVAVVAASTSAASAASSFATASASSGPARLERDLCLPTRRTQGPAFQAMEDTCPGGYLRVSADNPASVGLGVEGGTRQNSVTCLPVLDRRRAAARRVQMDQGSCPSGMIAVEDSQPVAAVATAASTRAAGGALASEGAAPRQDLCLATRRTSGAGFWTMESSCPSGYVRASSDNPGSVGLSIEQGTKQGALSCLAVTDRRRTSSRGILMEGNGCPTGTVAVSDDRPGSIGATAGVYASNNPLVPRAPSGRQDLCLPTRGSGGPGFWTMEGTCPSGYVRTSGDNPAAVGVNIDQGTKQGSLSCLAVADRRRAASRGIMMEGNGCPAGTVAVTDERPAATPVAYASGPDSGIPGGSDLCLPTRRVGGAGFRTESGSCPSGYVRVSGDNPGSAGVGTVVSRGEGGLTCLPVTDQSRAASQQIRVGANGCPGGTVAVSEDRPQSTGGGSPIAGSGQGGDLCLPVRSNSGPGFRLAGPSCPSGYVRVSGDNPQSAGVGGSGGGKSGSVSCLVVTDRRRANALGLKTGSSGCGGGTVAVIDDNPTATGDQPSGPNPGGNNSGPNVPPGSGGGNGGGGNGGGGNGGGGNGGGGNGGGGNGGGGNGGGGNGGGGNGGGGNGGGGNGGGGNGGGGNGGGGNGGGGNGGGGNGGGGNGGGGNGGGGNGGGGNGGGGNGGGGNGGGGNGGGGGCGCGSHPGSGSSNPSGGGDGAGQGGMGGGKGDHGGGKSSSW